MLYPSSTLSVVQYFSENLKWLKEIWEKAKLKQYHTDEWCLYKQLWWYISIVCAYSWFLGPKEDYLCHCFWNLQRALPLSITDAYTDTPLRLQEEKFTLLFEKSQVSHIRHVVGSIYCLVDVFLDRIPRRLIIISVVSFNSSELIFPCSLRQMFPPSLSPFGSDQTYILAELTDALQIDDFVNGA